MTARKPNSIAPTTAVLSLASHQSMYLIKDQAVSMQTIVTSWRISAVTFSPSHKLFRKPIRSLPSRRQHYISYHLLPAPPISRSYLIVVQYIYLMSPFSDHLSSETLLSWHRLFHFLFYMNRVCLQIDYKNKDFDYKSVGILCLSCFILKNSTINSITIRVHPSCL